MGSESGGADEGSHSGFRREVGLFFFLFVSSLFFCTFLPPL